MKTVKRRSPLDKTFFLESNKEKWCLIFSILGIAVLLANAYGFIKDPTPFLQFFLSIGVSFLLGASASDVMKSWKTDSTYRNEFVEVKESRNEKVERISEEIIEYKIHEKVEGLDAPEIKPFATNATGDENTEERVLNGQG